MINPGEREMGSSTCRRGLDGVNDTSGNARNDNAKRRNIGKNVNTNKSNVHKSIKPHAG